MSTTSDGKMTPQERKRARKAFAAAVKRGNRWAAKATAQMQKRRPVPAAT